MQPLIAPLYDGKSAHGIRRAALPGKSDVTGYDLVRAYWQKQHAGADFEQFWRKSLHDGWIEGTDLRAEVGFTRKVLRCSVPQHQLPTRTPSNSTSAATPPSTTDNSANNGWLQELPKPMTKLTWDNAILIGPEDGAALKA